ncbi:GFA family protein [Acuticoccus sediminis]|uniref:GFA family protein n=1 Tax=Acuticoccus sediminis TaxID=2184697 RepID=UPI001390A8BA|nr:GFA family protein [Acuticoccus sediminis]
MKSLTGECPCGSLSFGASGPAVWTVFCHCTECRDWSGSPLSLWVGFPSESVVFGGWILWRPGKSIDVMRGFCGKCGAAVIYRDRSMLQEETYVNGLLVHEPDRVKPAGHAFWRERISYIACSDDLPRWEGYSRARRLRLVES